MKTSFYSEQEARLFERKCKLSFALFITFLVLFAGVFALAIVFATYETKFVWMVIGCVLSVVMFCFAFLFFTQWKRRKESICLYRKILAEEAKPYRGTVIEAKNYPISLTKGLEAFEIEVELDPDNKKIFYLSSDKKGIFELKLNQTYLFWVASLYIKGVDDA